MYLLYMAEQLGKYPHVPEYYSQSAEEAEIFMQRLIEAEQQIKKIEKEGENELVQLKKMYQKEFDELHKEWEKLFYEHLAKIEKSNSDKNLQISPSADDVYNAGIKRDALKQKYSALFQRMKRDFQNRIAREYNHKLNFENIIHVLGLVEQSYNDKLNLLDENSTKH